MDYVIEVPHKILKDLLDAINEYDKESAVVTDVESASDKLKAYWAAKDAAEEYIKNL